jgi:hypothetical protein
MVNPWTASPWLVLPALMVSLLSWRRMGGRGRRRASVSVLALAAVASLTIHSVFMARGLRVDSDWFATRSFRVNGLLADVPLHDVWAVHVRGQGPTTIDQVTAALRQSSPLSTTPALAGLAAFRGVLGGVLGWDDPRWMDPGASYVGRLTESDRRRSTTTPGTSLGSWRVVYAFPDEAVVELMNGTVHVAVSCTIWEEAPGPTLFLAFRVREVNWSTSVYMQLIDPFRRYVVYPPLLRHLARELGRVQPSARH